MSTVVVTLKASPDKYKKDFDMAVTYLSQYTRKKGKNTDSKVSSIAQWRPMIKHKISEAHDTFKEMIEL